MYKIKTDMLASEKKLRIVLNKLELRRLGKEYSGGCPHEVCKNDLYDKYRGCDRFNSCKACWDKFLDDVAIAKKSNMEAYDVKS